MTKYKKLSFRVIGEVPLLMHNGQLANPTNEFSKQMKKINSKRNNKTDEDHLQLSKLEFLGGMYLYDGKPIIPGDVIEGLLTNAAKIFKLGSKAVGAIKCNENFFLEYDGEQDVKKRFDDDNNKYVVGVVIKKQRIIRTRPKFNKWAADIYIEYDANILNLTQVKDIIVRAGEVGLMDYRPKFGRFTVQF